MISMIWLPILLLALLALWVWLMVRTLRRQERYLWIILLTCVPPLGVVAYGVYALLENDMIPGMRGSLARWRQQSARRRAEHFLAGSDTPANHLEVARVSAALGDWEMTLRHVAPMLESDPESLLPQYLAGMALLRTGKANQAAAHLAYVVDEDPKYDVGRARLLYAQALQSLDRHDEAHALLLAMLNQSPRAEVACGIYQLLGGTPHEAAAREALEHSVSQYSPAELARLPAADRAAVARARALLRRRQ